MGIEGTLCFVLFGVLCVVVFGWAIYAGIRAKQEEIVDVRAHPNHVQDIIADSMKGFRIKEVRGRGQFNFTVPRRKDPMNPVISIDVEEAPNGATRVSIWMSEWGTQYGMVYNGGWVVSRRKKLVKKLEALESVA
jgi:hypothetical protein